MLFRSNPQLTEAPPETLPPLPPSPPASNIWRPIALFSSAALIALLAFTLATRANHSQAGNAAWSPDLEEIWKPLLEGQRPLLIAFSTPLFVEFDGSLLFRDKGEETWERAVASKKTAAVAAAPDHALEAVNSWGDALMHCFGASDRD